jgi:putative oxidoreductase
VVIQRLFSSFPDSWPGAGLLLLRLAIGVPAVVSALWILSSGPEPGRVVAHVMALSCGSLVLLGLWTPVAAGALALLQVLCALARHYDLMQLAAALVPLSLSVLGPGAWSIDAKLYGRKRLRV